MYKLILAYSFFYYRRTVENKLLLILFKISEPLYNLCQNLCVCFDLSHREAQQFFYFKQFKENWSIIKHEFYLIFIDLPETFVDDVQFQIFF